MEFNYLPWIQSKEIREHLENTWHPTYQEQERLILHAYRPLEEKVSALWKLQRFADSYEERAYIKPMWRLLQFALELIRRQEAGSLYLWKSLIRINERGFIQDSYGECELCCSYQELQERFLELTEQGDIWSVSKYILTDNGLQDLVEFRLEWVDGQPCETRFWLDDELVLKNYPEFADYVEACERMNNTPRHPYDIPFVTGDLVYLDAPCLPEPVFGVFCNTWDCHNAPYMWMGFIQKERNCFADFDMSYECINQTVGYRVIDWLHSADPTQLPAGQEILGELSAYMHSLKPEDAEAFYFQIFSMLHEKTAPKPYRILPSTMEEIIHMIERSD